MNLSYIKTVRLLLAVAPTIFKDSPFVLKGGTAINLFLRDMPRLSVDLDLVVADHRLSRDEAFRLISSALDSMAAELSKAGYVCEVGATRDGDEVKLFIQQDRTRLKVEVNHVFRGTVLPTGLCSLVPRAQEAFRTDLQLPVLHADELYGSKLVAAMDRQHPRDLFDVMGLYANGGLTPGMVECFVCYLAGHNRPVHEVLFGNEVEITAAFANEFSGMTSDVVTLEALLAVRRRLFVELPAGLTLDQRAFLCGLVSGEPDWRLMQCGHLAEMPAIRWKLENIRKLKKRTQKSSKLRRRHWTPVFKGCCRPRLRHLMAHHLQATEQQGLCDEQHIRAHGGGLRGEL